MVSRIKYFHQCLQRQYDSLVITILKAEITPFSERSKFLCAVFYVYRILKMPWFIHIHHPSVYLSGESTTNHVISLCNTPLYGIIYNLANPTPFLGPDKLFDFPTSVISQMSKLKILTISPSLITHKIQRHTQNSQTLMNKSEYHMGFHT